MTGRLQEAKLAQLHAKTDRDLAVLVAARLDCGFRLTHAPGSYEDAERAYSDANLWLSLTRQLPRTERRRMESQLSDLRAQLDRISAHQLLQDPATGCYLAAGSAQ